MYVTTRSGALFMFPQQMAQLSQVETFKLGPVQRFYVFASSLITSSKYCFIF